jgi:hypothetical protein
MSVCQKQTYDRSKPKISKLHPRGHYSILFPRPAATSQIRSIS